MSRELHEGVPAAATMEGSSSDAYEPGYHRTLKHRDDQVHEVYGDALAHPGVPASMLQDVEELGLDTEEREAALKALGALPLAERLAGRPSAELVEIQANEAIAAIAATGRSHTQGALWIDERASSMTAEKYGYLHQEARANATAIVDATANSALDKLAEAEAIARGTIEEYERRRYVVSDPGREVLARQQVAGAAGAGPVALHRLLRGVLEGEGPNQARLVARVAGEHVERLKADRVLMRQAPPLEEVIEQAERDLTPNEVLDAQGVVSAVEHHRARILVARGVVVNV